MTEFLYGTLSSSLAGRALDMLQSSRVGYLAVSDGLRDMCLLVAPAGLRLVSTDVELRQALSRAAGLTPAQQKVFEDTQDEREALLALGLSRSDVESIAFRSVEACFLNSLFWESPQAEAASGKPDFLEDLGGPEMRLLALGEGKQLLQHLRGQLAEARRVRRAIPALDVRVTHLGGETDLDRDANTVLEEVRQRPEITAAELVSTLGWGEYRLARELADLLGQGLIRIERQGRDSSQDAARGERVEQTLADSPFRFVRQLQVAKVAERAKATTGAARHFTGAARVLHRRGLAAESLELFSRALQQRPDSLEAQQGRVQILHEAGRGQEAARYIEELARRYVELGLYARARQVLDQALRIEATLPLELLLVDALAGEGNRERALSLGEGLLGKLNRAGQHADAEALAQRLLPLADRRRRTAIMQRTKRGKGAAVKALLAVALTLGQAGLLTLLLLDRSARVAFAAASARADSLKADGDPERLASLFPDTPPVVLTWGAGAEAFRGAHRELKLLRADASTLDELEEDGVVPVASAEDLVLARGRLEQASAQSAALEVLIKAQLTEIEVRGNTLDQALDRLAKLVRGPDPEAAFTFAKQVAKDHPAQRQALQQAVVQIQVDTRPTGASLTNVSDAGRVTPLALDVPLAGSRGISVELAGYEPQQISFALDGLSEPYSLIDLVPLPSNAKAWFQHRMQRFLLGKFDANEDGRLDDDERAQAELGMAERGRQLALEMLKLEFDQDGDGKLSKAERKRALETVGDSLKAMQPGSFPVVPDSPGRR